MEESTEYAFVNGLKAGFVDARIEAFEEVTPQFLVNSKADSSDVLSAIKQQMRTCKAFDFSVAFITEGGLQVLIETLNRMQESDIHGRILTTTYLNFNSPVALRKLLEYPNIETRIYQGNMHAKGYFFNQGDITTLIIGSANLTQNALMVNKEWNLLLHSYEDGEVLRDAVNQFEQLWEAPETVKLSGGWLDDYARYRITDSATSAKKSFLQETAFEKANSSETITPNSMQKLALESLADERLHGARKALLVSATGTGKTYLAALDVAQVKPRKVLFVVHRERILRDAQKSFERVLDGAYRYGFYAGGRKDGEATCLFAMVETLGRHLGDFARDEFDYIVIDEAHRSAAPGYLKILDYFDAEFLLGMTATPNRTGGEDIYHLYDNNIAYKISLTDALDSDMLAPFHYFGISDLIIDEEEQDDLKLFADLTSEARVDNVIRQIERYSVSREGRKGLVFCSRKDEARELARMFCERGYKARALTGENSDAERETAIGLLENSGNRGEYLEYIFTVDIFNEGVDIPALNQIIMLRPTDSAIIFVQQLGRGLRKCVDPFKEYTLVLDFIANYQKNFLIPVALSGDRTFNKDGLRVFVKEGSTTLPGCSTVSFDAVSEKRVLDSIDVNSFGTIRQVKEGYQELRRELGRIPLLSDFDRYDALDPLLIFSNKQLGSYHGFLKKYEDDYEVSFSQAQEDVLSFISGKLAAGKRAHELVMLRSLIDSMQTYGSVESAIARVTGRESDEAVLRSACRVLSNVFPEKQARARNADCVLISEDQDRIQLDSRFAHMLEDDEFKRQVLAVVDFGISRFERDYRETYKDTQFCIGKKYTYEDACRLLDWEGNVNGQNIGGYKYDAGTNTYPIFINYHKGDDISDTIRYEDKFLSQSDLIAISKQPRTMSSPEIMRLKAMPGNGMKAYLFVRKNKDDAESKEFYFLGEVYPVGGENGFKPFTMPNTTKSAVEIRYRLDVPVKPALYDYLTTSLATE